jgi:hypothetical protein
MKKIALSLLLAGSLFTLGSCERDFNCNCSRITTDDNGAVVSTQNSVNVMRDTRGNAREACEAMNATTSGGGFTNTVTCELEKR